MTCMSKNLVSLILLQRTKEPTLADGLVHHQHRSKPPIRGSEGRGLDESPETTLAEALPCLIHSLLSAPGPCTLCAYMTYPVPFFMVKELTCSFR